jgi:hypothetical protein
MVHRRFLNNGFHPDAPGDVLPPGRTSAAWDRQPSESARAYAAFERYLCMDPNERSLEQAARLSGKSTRHIERLSRDHDWVNRVAAFDVFQSQQVHDQLLRSKLELEKQCVAGAFDATDLPPLTAEDKANMTIMERAALLRVGAGIAARSSVVDPSVAHLFSADTPPPPTFVLQIIRPGLPLTEPIPFDAYLSGRRPQEEEL